MTAPRIFVSEPDLRGREEDYVVDALRSTWISSSGKYLDRFELEFASACGAAHCLTAANGTVALHLAMLAMGVGPGDEVIVPAMSFVATANAVRYAGAEPVFVDVLEDTWCIDPAQVERAITPRTRGIVPVHLYGQPAAMGPLCELADATGLWVVEDAAEAHFATYDGRSVGTLGRIGAFSFYGNKTLTCGEGGALVLDDEELARAMRLLRGQGMDPGRRYYHELVGYNYRLTNVACAILCAQLERRAEILAARRSVCDMYRAALAGSALALQGSDPRSVPSPWMMAVSFPDAAARNRAARRLDDAGIETRPFFHPLHRLPPYRDESMRRGTDAPSADTLALNGMCLPTHCGVTDVDVVRICSLLREA